MPERPVAATVGETVAVDAVRVAISAEQAETLFLIDQDARTLIEAAASLVDAETPATLGTALAHNLQVWVAIKTLATAESSALPLDIRHNLELLSGYVTRTTLAASEGCLTARDIQSLAEINLAIAEGLRQSQQNRLIRDRAQQLWDDEGRPIGRHLDHWLQAEREIIALLTAD